MSEAKDPFRAQVVGGEEILRSAQNDDAVFLSRLPTFASGVKIGRLFGTRCDSNKRHSYAIPTAGVRRAIGLWAQPTLDTSARCPPPLCLVPTLQRGNAKTPDQI